MLKFKLLKSKEKSEYWVTRFVFLRLLGFIYFIAFLSLAHQVILLIGENGLLPAKDILNPSTFGTKLNAFIKKGMSKAAP